MTLQTWNMISHRDDILAIPYARELALLTHHTVVCVCGVHLDDITREEIEYISAWCEKDRKHMRMKEPYDLRSALQQLEAEEGQLLITDKLIDTNGELAGVYRYIGGGGTLQRPTQLGPAMLFTNIQNHPGQSSDRTFG